MRCLDAHEEHREGPRKPFVGVGDDTEGEEHLASTPHQLTDAQRLALLYRLGQLTRCEAGTDPLTSQSAEVGLGYLDCEECQFAGEQEERGCHRFGLRLTAIRPWVIDYTGNEAHDKINFCPKSCVDEENDPPGRVSSRAILLGFSTYRKVKACGGLASFNGVAPADCPPRQSWFYASCEGVLSRYQAEVKDTQVQLQNAVVATLTRPGSNQDG